MIQALPTTILYPTTDRAYTEPTELENIVTDAGHFIVHTSVLGLAVCGEKLIFLAERAGPFLFTAEPLAGIGESQ